MVIPSSCVGVQAGSDLEMPCLSPPIPKPSSPSLVSNEHGSWKKNLFPDLRHPKNFRLRFIPPTVRNDKTIGVCQKSAIEGELALLDLTLVGFFLGRRPSFSYVKASLLKQWKIQGNVEVIQMLQGGYAFRFSDVKDRDSILEGDSYFVGGQPMFLRAWDRNIHTGGILGLRNIPLWVTLPGLPLHLWGEEALSTVSSVLGIPLYSDSNTATKSRLAFARVCIDFMGNKPLLESITVEDEMGLSYEQKVVYEWKPPHCLSCGIFGHEECAIKEMEMEVEQPDMNPNVSFEDGAEATHQHLQQERAIPEPFRRRFQEEKMVEDVEEGWEQIRVKKKRSRTHREPKMDHTRPGLQPGSQPVKGVQHMLSTSHWRRRNPAAGLGRKTGRLPHLGEFLNFKPCPSPHAGPLSLSDSKTNEKDMNTPLSEPLDSPSSIGDRPSGPTTLGSSAGHTPYPNRLVSLARELRRRPNRFLNPILPENRGLHLHTQSNISSPGPCPLRAAERHAKDPMVPTVSIEERGLAGTEVEKHGNSREKGKDIPEDLNRSGELSGFDKNAHGDNSAHTEEMYFEGQEGTVPSEI